MMQAARGQGNNGNYIQKRKETPTRDARSYKYDNPPRVEHEGRVTVRKGKKMKIPSPM
jgi:hypothetical protein